MDTTVHGAATAEPIGPSIEYSLAASASFSPPARVVADIAAPDGRASEQTPGVTFGWKARAKRFASGGSWIGVWIATVIAEEIRVRRDMRHLATMSDHMLKDIGLRRADIRDAVRYGRD